MISKPDLQLIKQIAERAASLHEQLFLKRGSAPMIVIEVGLVHSEVVPLRLRELLDSPDLDFAHDIYGIHEHLVLGKPPQLSDGFSPRFAVEPASSNPAAGI